MATWKSFHVLKMFWKEDTAVEEKLVPHKVYSSWDLTPNSLVTHMSRASLALFSKCAISFSKRKPPFESKKSKYFCEINTK